MTLLLILFAACRQGSPPAPADGPPRAVEHVVLISVDGLRPEFYLSGGGFEAPNLARLAQEGARADRVEVVFPSVTYPVHASIVTGVRPRRHGIVSNKLPEDPRRWIWEADRFRSPPLWQVAREAGRSVAIVYWPTTVGADVDWLIPERWDHLEGETKIGLLRELSRPAGFFEEIEREVPGVTEETLASRAAADRLLAQISAYLIRTRRPSLLLTHLIQVDFAQHASGREHENVRRALRQADECVGIILDAIRSGPDAMTTTVVVTGDHGFLDVSQEVSVGALLARAGIERDAGVRVLDSGSQAAVYVDEPDLLNRVREALGAPFAEGTPGLQVLERPALDERGYGDGPMFAIVAPRGFTVSGRWDGDVVRRPRGHGDHGYLPEVPEMGTGFIAWGAGVRADARVESMRTIDVAPTIAELLGLRMDGVEGRVVREVFPP